MSSTAAVAAPSVPTGGVEGRRGALESMAGVAGSRGEGALDLAPKPGCGVAAAVAPQSALGSVEGEGMPAVVASSMLDHPLLICLGYGTKTTNSGLKIRIFSHGCHNRD